MLIAIIILSVLTVISILGWVVNVLELHKSIKLINDYKNLVTKQQQDLNNQQMNDILGEDFPN